MAGRTPLTPGEVRSATITRNPDGTVTARAYVRDAAGVRRNPRATAATEHEARSKLEEKATRLAFGAGVTGASTLRDLLDLFIAEKHAAVDSGALRPQTVRVYADTVRWLGAIVGGLPVADVTPARVRAILDTVTRTRSAAARRQARVVLSGAFSIAVEADVINHNPVGSLRRETHATARTPTALNVEQVNVLREVLRERAARNERFVGPAAAYVLPTVVEVAVGAGLRVGEILALRNRDIDLDGGMVTVTGTMIDDADWRTVRQSELKARSQARVLAIPRFTVGALTAARTRQVSVTAKLPTSPAIPGRVDGVPPQARNVRRALRDVRTDPRVVDALRESGLSPGDLTPHLLRRTAATLLATATGDLRGSQLVLGHADERITRSAYAGVAFRQVASAVALDDILGGAAS